MIVRDDIKKGIKFEIQFYDKDGYATDVIRCDNEGDVAMVLAQWCWSRVHGNCPTVYHNGYKYSDVPMVIKDADKYTILSKRECRVSIPELYDNICVALNGRVGTDYDCTKVTVGEKIFEECKDYHVLQGGTASDFGMLWLMYGPRATLKGYDVEVEEGWCTL